jgi:hypothetical protein
MAALTELVSDLKALRKGRGLFVNNVDERVGRTLRDVCGVTEQDGPGEIRYRVAQRLAHLAGDLPEDLRMAAMAAFGMIPAARRPLYQDRVDWIAQRIGRDPRTARRRIDDAIHQLAQLACTPLRVRGPAEPTTGWHIAETRVILMLDRAVPERYEHHRIVAAQEHLTELDLSTTFAPPAVEVDVVYGGTLRAGRLVLPEPLDPGSAHEFALRSRMPAGPRQLVQVPRRRCDQLELRVRFDGNRLPRTVSRLHGRPPRTTAQIPIDPAGEIRVTFSDLTRGHTHGTRWDY